MPEDMRVQVNELVERILQNQEIQALKTQRSLSASLDLYCRSRKIWGDIIFMAGLNEKKIN